MTTKVRYIKPARGAETRTIEQIKADTGLDICPGAYFDGAPLKPQQFGYPCGKPVTRPESGMCGTHDNRRLAKIAREAQRARYREQHMREVADHAEAMNLAMLLTDAAPGVQFDARDKYVQLTMTDARVLLKLLQR